MSDNKPSEQDRFNLHQSQPQAIIEHLSRVAENAGEGMAGHTATAVKAHLPAIRAAIAKATGQ